MQDREFTSSHRRHEQRMQQCLCSRKSPTECKRGIYQLSQHQISLPHNSHHRPYRFTALRQHRSLFMLPMQTWSVLLLLASLIGACLATLEDHKNIVYVVPRPGIDKKTDCYINLYHQEIERDLQIMHELGATTIVTTNAWQWDAQHSQFLKGLANFNQSLAITMMPQLGDNSMRKYLEAISTELSLFKVKLEFFYVDFELKFDNAEAFFMFAGKLRTWLDQLEFRAPLVIRFFKEVTSDAQIESLLDVWDWSGFDAWGVTVFSDTQAQNWIKWVQPYRKKLLLFYGADSVNLTSPRSGDNATEDAQQKQLFRLWNTVVQSPEILVPSAPSNNRSSTTKRRRAADLSQETNKTASSVILGTALVGYVDALFLGDEAQNYQGAPLDICPDQNPYLQTTCGIRDAAVAFGDAIVSVEHLGIFGTTETLALSRCVIPKAAVATLRRMWKNTTDEFPASKYCCFSISVYPLELIWVTLSFVGIAVIVSIIISIISACTACSREKLLKLAARRDSAEPAELPPATLEGADKQVEVEIPMHPPADPPELPPPSENPDTGKKTKSMKRSKAKKK